MSRFEGFFDYCFRHLYRVSLLSLIYTPFMILISISFDVWESLNYDSVSSYFGVPFVFLGLTVALLSITYVFIDKVQVQRNQKRAEYRYNPTFNMSFTPFQQMQLRGRDVAVMEFLLDGDKEKLADKLDMVRRWSHTGFIDKNDVPKSIREYFILKNERI